MEYTTRETQYTGRRSVAETLLETINETLGHGRLAPTLHGRTAVRRRRFSRIAAIGAMLAGAAALGMVFFQPNAEHLSPGGEPVALLAVSRGPVTILGAGTQAAPRLLALPGEPIHAGAVIDTGAGESASRTAIQLAGGQSMRLDTASRVRFESSASVTLERGAVYFDSASGASVEVRTALGVVRDIGTQFEVRLLSRPGAGPALRVRVREGAVVLERAGGSHHAIAGEELRLNAGGTVERGTSPLHGPEWDWVLDTAPAPQISGKPLADFLDWASREGGWKVRFADDATARAAADTVLHGDLQNLSVTEASSMVLHGSGLAYRLEGGTFVVEPRSMGVDEPATP